VAVIGGGDTAIEDAMYLAGFANKIYVVHRRDELRAQKALQKAAMNNDKIAFVWDSVVDSIVGDGVVSGVRVKNKKTDEVTELAVSGVFIAVGTEPQSEEVKELVATDESGYIIADQNQKTSVPGVFAAGDIVAKPLRQVVTAAADGAVAIYSAQAYLYEKE
jgi:thioredoxin reductase (NADPH)